MQTPMTGPYNAAVDLLGRNLAHRPTKVASIDPAGRHTYAEVAARSERMGAALLGLGLAPGERVALIQHDGIDLVCCFLGAMRAGLVPIPLNTLLQVQDYAYILTDSGARALVVSEALLHIVNDAVSTSGWPGEIVVSGASGRTVADLLAEAREPSPAYESNAEDVAFWLYSSGSTGRPKGAPHRHRSLGLTAELFAAGVFGLRETDVVFSAAKLFFAYGLGNALTFPMCLGATAVLFPGRVTPEVVGELIERHAVTVLCGVPTLYAAVLTSPHVPPRQSTTLRLCMSAGEGLPAELGHAWTRLTGAEIIDGIGSTEMLHIFVSNRPGQVRYGATGLPVPGYEARLVGDDGGPVSPGEVGELYIRGPTMTVGYWNQAEKTRETFVDGWMRSGDKFEIDADGFLTHRGRADDMLKVGGIWVSPLEVEAAILGHAAVLETAVVGVPDSRPGEDQGLRRVEVRPRPEPGPGGGAAGLRQIPTGALQVPSPDRVRRRPAEDRHG
jgi:benzoate-CoA ligase